MKRTMKKFLLLWIVYTSPILLVLLFVETIVFSLPYRSFSVIVVYGFITDVMKDSNGNKLLSDERLKGKGFGIFWDLDEILDAL